MLQPERARLRFMAAGIVSYVETEGAVGVEAGSLHEAAVLLCELSDWSKEPKEFNQYALETLAFETHRG